MFSQRTLAVLGLVVVLRRSHGFAPAMFGYSNDLEAQAHFQRQSTAQWRSRYADDADDADNDKEEEEDAYWVDDNEEEGSEQVIEPRSYNVRFEGGYDEEQQKISWEQCDDGSTWVLLPPPFISKPTAVIHFVGGSLFGSSPKLWYRKLLEGIVRTTPCTIVATSIPVTLFKNPLQHVTLSRELQRQFQNAYVDVLEDEYGDISDVPVIGMGHSLGARLLMVSATLGPDKGISLNIPDYQAYILMSFTNYGASVSVPGVEQLLQQRNFLDEEEERYGRFGGRRRRKQQRQSDWDEDEWEELEESFRNQANRFRDALTPRSDELEFYPTPEQLWKAISVYNRYSIPKTLLVQFEDDMVDQSSRLASPLLNVSDVKFARLKGYHLTPVSAETESDTDRNDWLRLPGKATQMIWKAIQGKSERKKSAKSILELRQSIVRYIMDEATH